MTGSVSSFAQKSAKLLRRLSNCWRDVGTGYDLLTHAGVIIERFRRATFHGSQVTSVERNRPPDLPRVSFRNRLQTVRVRTVAGKCPPSFAFPVKRSSHGTVVWLTCKVSRIVFENSNEDGLKLPIGERIKRYKPHECDNCNGGRFSLHGMSIRPQVDGEWK